MQSMLFRLGVLTFLLFATGCAHSANPAIEAPLLRKTYIVVPDRHQVAEGTLIEFSYESGPTIGLGFPSIRNTRQQRLGNRLSVFVDDDNHSYEVTDLGKPFDSSGAVFFTVGGKVYVRPYPIGSDRVYALNDETNRWSSISDEEFSRQVAKYLRRWFSIPSSCGYVIDIVGNTALTRNCLVQRGKTVHFDKLNFPGLGNSVSKYSVFFDNRRIVFHVISTPNFLAYCDYPIKAEACQLTPYVYETGFAYAVFSSKDRVYVASNAGRVYALGAHGPGKIAIDNEANESFQLYSSMKYSKSVLLGEYPKGELLEWDRGLKQFQPPPDNSNVAGVGSELQSLELYKGRIVAGFWPTGELKIFDKKSGEWEPSIRLFPDERLDPSMPYQAEPYFDHLKALGEPITNLLGQRIADLLVEGDSLYVATSSKTGGILDPEKLELDERVLADYGKIYRVRSTGQNTIDLLSEFSRKRPFKLGIELRSSTLKVLVNGHVVTTVSYETDSKLEHPDRVQVGEGSFGTLLGATIMEQ
ncbi:MAG: hypothetical protein Q8S09_07895 [Hyphomonas sp.]|nr:hypothetical protein [Hyphomonas sp.]